VKGQENPAGSNQKAIAFADYLFNTRQYEFAAQEYLKLIYIYPENAMLKKRVLESFRMQNDLESGLYFSEAFFLPGEPSTLNFYNEIVKIRMLSEKTILSDELLIDSSKFEMKYNESLLLDYMLSLEWEEIHKNANKIKTSDLYRFTQHTPEDEYLSPFLAATLSTVIPGSGKIYAKRWKDGLSSLLFVGLTGFQAYRGFNKNGTESVYGWIMGGLSFGFYISNIYGSQKAAKQYNIRLNEEYKKSLVNFYLEHY
jgi:hypothetical protein